MAEKIGNDKVKYESPVTKIEQDDQGVRVTTLKGDVFEVGVSLGGTHMLRHTGICHNFWSVF